MLWSRRTSRAVAARRLQSLRSENRILRANGRAASAPASPVAERMESRLLLTTYYVGGTGAADGNDGTTQPWATLQHAADFDLHPGDTVIVRAGSYDGFRRFDKPGGTDGNPITFKADSGAVVTLTHRVSTAAAEEGIINIENNANNPPQLGYYVIDGFVVDGTTENSGRGIRSAGSTNNIIRNNKVHHAPDSNIFASRSDRILIENNECYNARAEHGIYVSGTDGYTIRGNTSYGNYWNGIHTNIAVGTNQTNTGGLIETNVIRNNLKAGMDFDGMGNGTIRNNLVYNNMDHAVVLYNSNDSDTVPTVASHDLTIVNNTFEALRGNTYNCWALKIAALGAGGQPADASWTGNDDGVIVFNNILLGGVGSGSLANFSSDLSGKISSTFKSNNNVVKGAFRAANSNDLPLADWRTITEQDQQSDVSTEGDLFEQYYADEPVSGTSNYHLKAGSPAINRGAATFNSKSAPNVDVEGDLRQLAPGYDAGYDELGYDGNRPSSWASLIGGVVTVNGTSTGETIRAYATSGTPITTYVKVDATMFAGSTGVSSLKIYANGGDDTVYVETANIPPDSLAPNLGNTPVAAPATIYGGDNNDTIYDGDPNDTVFGDAGDDTFKCGMGADVFNGGTGTDTADYSGRGTNNLTVSLDGVANDGQNDVDQIHSGNQPEGDNVKTDVEVVNAAGGNDSLTGSSTGVTLRGFGGNDVLRGGSGTDTLDGGPGQDTVYGAGGGDTIFGGPGNDSLYGDDPAYTGVGGNDFIFGDDGDDWCYGGYGGDTLTGGFGRDTLKGEEGDDTFQAKGDNYVDTLYGGPGIDTARLATDRDNNDLIPLEDIENL